MASVEDKNWHLVTVSHGGTVSFIRNLSLTEVIQVRDRLDPLFGVTIPPGGLMRYCQDSDIEKKEILGPPEWDGCPKALQHDWSKETFGVGELAPHVGQRWRSVSCTNCNAMKPS